MYIDELNISWIVFQPAQCKGDEGLVRTITSQRTVREGVAEMCIENVWILSARGEIVQVAPVQDVVHAKLKDAYFIQETRFKKMAYAFDIFSPARQFKQEMAFNEKLDFPVHKGLTEENSEATDTNVQPPGLMPYNAVLIKYMVHVTIQGLYFSQVEHSCPRLQSPTPHDIHQIILTALKAELTTYFTHTDCQGHSALVPAQQLSTVGVSLPRQPALQEDSARLPLRE